MPAIYFIALFTGGALYPDYSHMTQVASDLGAMGAPYDFATEFNIALLIVGLTGLAGALGLTIGLWKLAVSHSLSVVIGFTVAMPAVSLIISALFPLPSPHHSSFLLLLMGNLTPLLGGIALRKLESSTVTRWILYLAFVTALIVISIIFGVGNIINEDNLGFWLRIWAAVSLPTVAVVCLAVRMRLPKLAGV